jgi:monoamine oxidase
MKYDCVIIGAGAAGLIAANKLGKAGKQVLVLEARSRAGGRIYTLSPPGFSRYIESGAEFMHGNLPLTSSLLRKANIPYTEMHGEMYQLENGDLQEYDFFNDEFELVAKALRKMRNDMPFEEFLNLEFPEEKYQSLNHNIRKFVEGYNAADIRKISSFSLRDEWLQDNDQIQYRPEGGYGRLIAFLLNENNTLNVVTKLSQIVTLIRWQVGKVETETIGGETYEASKVIITVPIGVLQTNALAISPPIPDYFNASKRIGFGSVVKFIIQFKESFWLQALSGKLASLKFLFSDAPVPTWWTQLPDKTPILTGWLGGPSASKINSNEEYLTRLALTSLAYIFKCSAEILQTQFTAFHIEDWKSDRFCPGAYSYATIETKSAKKILTSPVDNTLYFAGEGIYDGPSTGTVEAALVSGEEVARKILASMQ